MLVILGAYPTQCTAADLQHVTSVPALPERLRAEAVRIELVLPPRRT